MPPYILPVKMYVTKRSRVGSIMDLIGPELSKLFALEFEKKKNKQKKKKKTNKQRKKKKKKKKQTNKQKKKKKKKKKTDFVYTLASTNMDLLVPNMVTICSILVYPQYLQM